MWHIYWHDSPSNIHQEILAYDLYMAFEGHICCWHIFYSSMVNQCFIWLNFSGCVQECGFCRYTIVELQLDIYQQCGKLICSRAYVSNVKCMYGRVPGYIFDCNEFIWGICTVIVVLICPWSNWHMWIYMAFEGHICWWHIHGCSLVKLRVEVCCLLFVCAVLCSLLVNYSIMSV